MQARHPQLQDLSRTVVAVVVLVVLEAHFSSRQLPNKQEVTRMTT